MVKKNFDKKTLISFINGIRKPFLKDNNRIINAIQKNKATSRFEKLFRNDCNWKNCYRDIFDNSGPESISPRNDSRFAAAVPTSSSLGGGMLP